MADASGLSDCKVHLTDHNYLEGQIRPIAVGKHNWLFASSLRSGKRAGAVMTLLNWARLNGYDPYAYMKDMLQRLREIERSNGKL